MLKNTKIITKCILMAGFVLLALLGQSIVNRQLMSSISDDIDRMQQKTLPALEATYNLKLNIVQIQQWLTDISATRAQDGLDDGFSEAEKNNQQALAEISNLKHLLPSHQTELASLQSAIEQYYDRGQQMAKAYIEQGTSAGNKMMDPFDETSAVLQARVEQLESVVQTIKDDSNHSVKYSVGAAQTSSLVSFFVVFVIIGLLMWLLKMWVIKPLNTLSVVFNDLNQGEANLNFRFNDIQNNEFGEIQRAFNEFLLKLKLMADSIVEKVEFIYQDIAKLDESTGHVSTQTSALFARVDTLASAMSELAATSEEVARAMDLTSNNVNGLQGFLKNGGDSSKQTELAVLEVYQRISQSSEVITQVEQQTSQIVGMVENIRAIADQTNLLALNAAIEAARAGEQGRGFAVVADEVRALASRTQVSTGEINQIIQSLQSSSASAVNMMNLCLTEVNRCVDFAKSGKTAIDESMQQTRQVNDQVLTVTGSMGQQASVVGENTETLVAISESAGVLESTIVSTLNSIASLSSQAKQLNVLARTFDKGMGS